MHQHAFDFVRGAIEQHVVGDVSKVAELGSYDVNGSVRPLLAGASEYIGIDCRPGPGVDLVADAEKWKGKGFDLIVSTETLEHAERPYAIINTAHRALKNGGLFIATMAAPERRPHNVDGGGQLAENEHYANISVAQLQGWLHVGWDILDLQHHSDRGDLYVVARKRPTKTTTGNGNTSLLSPFDADLERETE